jgi:POT family proton-dependent oligopeptide transporter
MSDTNEKSAADVVEKADLVPNTHPKAFYFFFWGEFAERCSYYGMRAILPLYLTGVLQFADGDAVRIYSYFKSACYFLPLLGGFLADRYFGKYWTIVGFSIPYVLGQFLLGVENKTVLILSLCLLAAGSGVIKPNISTLMGLTYDQKRPGQAGLRSAAFLWFYFSINVGAMISLYALPEIRNWVAFSHEGALNSGAAATATHDLKDVSHDSLALAYKVAFQFPAWLMVAALAVFALGKRHYAVEVIDRGHEATPEERAQRWQVLSTLFGVFTLIIFFWVAYEQNDNLWTFFARDHMDRTLDLGFWKKEFAPDGFQFINALLVLILVPAFAQLWRRVDPQGTRFPPATKILIGFLVTAGSAGVMSLAGYAAADGTKVSAWWIVLAYFVLTVGEVLVYGTGLELSYTAAPANMKGFVTACFLVTNTLGNLVNSQFSPLYETPVPAGDFFAITAAITLAASVAFYFVGRRFNRSTAPNQDAAGA